MLRIGLSIAVTLFSYTATFAEDPSTSIRSSNEQALLAMLRKGLDVTSRVIINPLPEQLRPLALPVLEGGDGRSALQG